MDINALASMVATQTQKIELLQEELKRKEQAQEELIKRLDSINISMYHAEGKINKKAPSARFAPVPVPSCSNKTSKSKSHASPTKNKPTKSTSKPRYSTPVSKSNAPTPSSSRRVSLPNPKAAAPSPKRNENQMIMKETPEGFKTTKESLYCFIRLLWGMVEAGAVPPPPDQDNIAEFTAAFASSDQIKNVLDSNMARELVPHHEVLTLQGIQSGRRKMGRFIINIQEFYIKITQSSLAKLGIRVWGPNVLDPIDSLWNEACRMSAIKLFRRMAIGGAFQYMNINKVYVENFELIEGAYNHYVHYVLAEKYKKELKEEGKNVKDEEKKVIQRNRQRLRTSRMKYATNQGFKQRYLDLIDPIDAHSDDEYSEKHNCYIVKSLEYRSENADAFFERLSQEMEKNDRLEGKRPQTRMRRRPAKPVMSTIARPPRNMSIDFFKAEWFNQLSSAQKSKYANAHRVSMLPNAKLSFRPVSAQDERLGDKAFIAKYWDKLTGVYDLSHELGDEDESEEEPDEDEQGSDYGTVIDLDDTSGGEEEEGEGLDEEEEEDGDFVPAEEGEEEESEFLDPVGEKMDGDGDARMFEDEDDARDARQDALRGRSSFDWNEWQ